jgi:probable rRNA maturation factor
MALELTLQRESALRPLPGKASFATWLGAALSRSAVVTVRLVDEIEGRALNRDFRGKDYATNVLTFVYSDARGAALIGDIVLCAPVLAAEAIAQGKRLRNHYAHLTVHAALHLAGMDHLTPSDAEAMEAREVRILKRLGVANPYEST